MPIPFLLAGLGVAAGALGVGGHLDAKETNEKAQAIAKKAQELYDNENQILMQARKKAENSLVYLLYAKKKILFTSFQQFVIAYNKIRDYKQKESKGLDELSNFVIEPQDIVEMQKLADIYQSIALDSVAGAVTGTAIAVAASGALPAVTSALSFAGTAVGMGEIGLAASSVGSAFSAAAAATPLAAIAAPVVLFTGISASIKADENLEKAQTFQAEVEAAVEKMKIDEDFCYAIVRRSDMLENLLRELDVWFSQCACQLERIVHKKTGFFKGDTVDSSKLTDKETKIFMVTRSLAKAIKTVIDTPVLDPSGKLSGEFQQSYNIVEQQLPVLQEKATTVQSYNLRTKNVKPAKVKASKPISVKQKPKKKELAIFDTLGDVFSYILIALREIFLFILIAAIVVIVEPIAAKLFLSSGIVMKIIIGLLWLGVVMGIGEIPWLFRISKLILRIAATVFLCILIGPETVDYFLDGGIIKKILMLLFIPQILIMAAVIPYDEL